jgi:hypothetical protein
LVDGEVKGRILKSVIREEDVRLWAGYGCLSVDPVLGSCEHCNELSGCIK